jgi:hypothetical protein
VHESTAGAVATCIASIVNACLNLRPAGGYTAAVDVYNSSTGIWSIAQLSIARGDLSATSVGDLAIFAGGWTSALFCSVHGSVFVDAHCVLFVFL